MDIHLRKIQLAQTVLNLEDEKTIALLEEVLKEKRIKSYESQLEPMSLSVFREEIAKAEKDFKEGNYTDAETLLKKYS